MSERDLTPADLAAAETLRAAVLKRLGHKPTLTPRAVRAAVLDALADLRAPSFAAKIHIERVTLPPDADEAAAAKAEGRKPRRRATGRVDVYMPVEVLEAFQKFAAAEAERGRA